MRLRTPLFLLLLVVPLGLNAQQPIEPVPADSASPPPALTDSACLVPVHPDILRQAGIEGRVRVAFVVDTTGVVEPTSVRVLSSSHRLFERPALAAVSRCRFSPGRAAGRVVRVRMQQAVNFTLPAGTSHGWPVLGRLTHLCSGSVAGVDSHISWEVFTSPDSTDRLLATYRARLGVAEQSRDEWIFRATSGERSTRILVIRPTPPFVQRECPAAPTGARTFVMFSQMTAGR